ncbi:hypothetical protein [Tepidibacillus sp. HK-1]|uniref:hypothetical protein n=1 Tax=Tepidibacillus sp. HK-1 TaxID=1883407 RepID=UPI0008539974|nr:hypothetical protein [Tepidibacillus sp. HK-1]GBF11582.1 hypothetical protein HK1_01617 [Tepidibacillus sp. HK-1]
MNSSRLSKKDFFVIYYILFILILFLTGFFLGAKVMEKQLKANVPTNIDQNTYTEAEIISFNKLIFLPTQLWLKEVYEKINQSPIDLNMVNSMQKSVEEMKTNMTKYQFSSPYLQKSIELIQQSLEQMKQYLENPNRHELLNQAIQYYLQSQTQFYRHIWVWEQENRNPISQYIDESLVNWNEWNKASIHQKNYIIAMILAKDTIITFYKPEDITVHIDAYAKANRDTTMNLEELIQFLISTNAIHEKDFLLYKDWYQGAPLPKIPNFN